MAKVEAATGERKSRGGKAATTAVAKRYFAAIGARDLDGMTECWRPGATDRLIGQADLVAPDDVREWFGELFAAIPDFSLQVTEMVADSKRCAVQWRATGTFTGPGRFQGLEPTGARLELEGCDVVQVEGDELVHNDAYMDGMEIARQLGALPARGAKAETRMASAVNARTRMLHRIADPPEEIADGVWIVRGGFPRKGFNVYFVRDGDGVLMFDAGIRAMTNALAAAGAQLGGITRIVLGHSHVDHRGAAPGLRGIPVYVHPDEVADAEGDGGLHYADVSQIRGPARWLYPRLLNSWDGGPVTVAGTLSEGDEVAGFQVIHLPGHAPGLIALWRESDRLALVTDAFYTADPERFTPGPPRVAHPAFSLDTEQARQSMRKLAALEPAAAWPGHAEPLTGDVRGQLEHAAATT
jgi:glyoxylase-like metal-dependent hydrolase (beta-lactamase superfamily II)/predicted ester cyclase